MRLALAVLVVLLLGHSSAMAAKPRSLVDSLAPAARASSFDANAQRFTDERPMNDPWLAQLRDTGVKFWGQRNVSVPTTTTIDVSRNLDDGGGTDATARGYSLAADPNGRVVFNSDWLGSMLAGARDKRSTIYDRRTALGDIASILFHELGHVGGLDHSAAGIMGTDGAASENVPWAARSLIAKLLPPHPPVHPQQNLLAQVPTGR